LIGRPPGRHACGRQDSQSKEEGNGPGKNLECSIQALRWRVETRDRDVQALQLQGESVGFAFEQRALQQAAEHRLSLHTEDKRVTEDKRLE
jgi:hypothetical protein